MGSYPGTIRLSNMAFGACMFLLSLLCSLCSFCVATDTITAAQFVKDGDEGIVSVSNTFKLGFFSPGSSTNRYVGIWRNNVPASKPVWVANRNNPLMNDFSGVVTISEDGNIVVLNGQQQIVWSSNVSDIRVRNSTAQLTDDGNLVLRGSTSGEILWESFNNLTDTYMPKMRLTANARTGERIMLTSWKSSVDPSVGAFSGGLNPLDNPEVLVGNESRLYWRSGPWNGQVFIGVPDMYVFPLGGFDIEKDVNGTVTLSLSFANPSLLTNIVLNSDGNVDQSYWDSDKKSWVNAWKSRKSDCDVYGFCGDFGICTSKNSPICSCLNGFQPKDPDEWSRENWVSGCVRKSLLKCESQPYGGDQLGKDDGFFKVDNVKVPDFVDLSYSSASEESCREQCLNNCSCTAYAYHTGIYCMLWSEKLTDIQKFSSEGADLYIRLAHSEFDGRRKLKAVFILVTVVGAITICICSFYAWIRWIAKYPAKKRQKEEAHPTSLDQILLKDNMNKKLQDLRLFKLQELTTATANFDALNMLGEGGFGPVHKGKLPDGLEIAVKRLSRASGQGLEEFMNEVVVISNLQHRNLVRLLGCCVEEGEKMLVYEYMPNKSLDAFLFDPLRHGLLDWNRRFRIVEGICRGLLYLHRDSRLRIIHRDLKASNILLDHELNPKISDFGMARIFGLNEHQANTRRVMGTFGYMSPEYATQGRFSEKSDIFSLGVLLLEIVCGRRNTSFYGDDQALSLLGFAWKLWNEGNILDLMDPDISDSDACLQVEILRCIHVGLLCVEELAKDRPTISTVISMLNCEIADLPAPKHPAFAARQSYLETEACKIHSINDVTVSILTAR